MWAITNDCFRQCPETPQRGNNIFFLLSVPLRCSVLSTSCHYSMQARQSDTMNSSSIMMVTSYYNGDCVELNGTGSLLCCYVTVWDWGTVWMGLGLMLSTAWLDELHKNRKTATELQISTTETSQTDRKKEREPELGQRNQGSPQIQGQGG